MAYNRWLAHHGVKGQKWGERNGPPYPLNSSISDGHKLIKSDGSPQSKKRKPTPPNTTYVKNHKGPMYFISDKELDGQTLEPRVVDNYFTKNGYEDNQTKRISFAPDVGKCLSGLSQNVTGKQFNVYVPDVEEGIDVYKPNSKAVPDAEITQEMWVTEPVKVKKLGSITCTGDTGEDGHKFRYGDKTAELYDWNYEWNTSYASKDVKKANDIYKTLSKQEKYFLTAEENSKRYVSREEYGKKGTNAYSLIEQYKDTPVSVIDIWKNDRGGADVSIAVRNNSKYRHKGYASRALENGLKYFYDHPEIEYLIWGVNSQNRPSIELAKKYGFYLYDKRDDGWEIYTLDQKKEVKHTMAYNRWLSTEYLAHHGVKGQKWGERNGPPYPLDSSLSDGSKLLPKATGSPQTKKKYKTSEKTAYQRKKRQEKIESSPDYQEKHSTAAEIKRGYRALKKKYGEYRQKRDEERQKLKEQKEQERQKQDKAREDAVKRLNDTNMSDEEKQKLIDDAWTSDRFDADKLNKALDEYAKEPARAKEHGTIDEVLKFRDQYSKEDWDSITSRLEAESKVHKLKQTAANAVTPPSDKKIRKIYEKGTAREVYQNRDKFTVEQLEAIEKRLTAEEKIGKLANNQVFITPDRVKKLEQVRDVLKVVGDMATTANTISKAFGGGGDGSKNKGDNNNNKSKGNDSGESKRTTVVVEETKKDGTVKKTTTTDSTDKGPTAWLDKRKKKE